MPGRDMPALWRKERPVRRERTPAGTPGRRCRCRQGMRSSAHRDHKEKYILKNTPLNDLYYYHTLERMEIEYPTELSAAHNEKNRNSASNGTSYQQAGGPDLIVNGAISDVTVPQSGEKVNSNLGRGWKSRRCCWAAVRRREAQQSRREMHRQGRK